jgi:ABC-type iron transport system FetAB ATPase subunit
MSINFDDIVKIKKTLDVTVKELKISIDAAILNMTEIYGEDHYSIQRLQSYYPALKKQVEYVKQLDKLIECSDYDNIMIFVSKIRAISEMIKEDAKSLLLSLQTGKDIVPDKENEIN